MDNDHLWPKVFLPPNSIINTLTELKMSLPQTRFENNIKDVFNRSMGATLIIQKQKELVTSTIKSAMAIVCKELVPYNISCHGDDIIYPTPDKTIYFFHQYRGGQQLTCPMSFTTYVDTGDKLKLCLDIDLDTVKRTINSITEESVADAIIKVFNDIGNFLDCFKHPVATPRG